MVMDPTFREYSDSINGVKLDDETVVPSFDQSSNLASGFKFKDDSLDLSFLDLPYLPDDSDPGTFVTSSATGSEMDSPDNFSDTVFQFLNQTLMEENMEEKPSVFHDQLTLQASEKSFYEVLGETYPPRPSYQPLVFIDHGVESHDNFCSSEYSTNSSTSANQSTDPLWVDDSLFQSSVVQTQNLEYPSQFNLQNSSQWSFGFINSTINNAKGLVDSSVSTLLVPNIFNDNESILQFKRGMEEASKFLPSGNQLVIDLDKDTLPLESEGGAPEVVVQDERDNSPNGSRGRKHYHRQDSGLEEGRSGKQSAVYVDEVELSERFDRVLLCCEAKGGSSGWDDELPSEVDKTLQQKQNEQTHRSSGGRTRAKKQDSISEVVDVRTLLISCAQSVAADDRRTANEQLKQIRQHSSPSGDATQRLAHIFANSLKARLAGTGTQICEALASKRISATEKLKGYQVYISACPFHKIAECFANNMILDIASTATTLHIIDFGIQYGFHFPMLIQLLSMRPGGPPKLRITGIDLPQPGFRPAERVEETGRWLAYYCVRFDVPFEYRVIATQKWETIKIEDLNIDRKEVLAVNCLFRFENLLDETVDVNSPRDSVLKLIRKMNPDIFVHAVINGSYNAPFFVNRFRAALFHYSAIFDLFDTTLASEDRQKFNFEEELFGREVMNVVACEGSERVERPEPYKQWQARNKRAGFRLLPVNQELMKKFKDKVKISNNIDDFVADAIISHLLGC